VSNRGFWGMGIYRPLNEVNIGTLWRSAFVFGADFIFTIGKRYKHQSSDTVNAWRHVPFWNFLTIEDFKKAMPKDSVLVCVEISPFARSLSEFTHPERAIYILGAEDSGIPQEILSKNICVQIKTERDFCLNVAVAGTLIMYDRMIKNGS
jgi:tRNA G18 (ribose-2'-O)-methylase SpoU